MRWCEWPPSKGSATADTATRQRYLPRMLDDPARAVRVEAAHALAGAPEQGLSESQRASFAKALAEYVAVQTYVADRPEGRMNLGNVYAQRGDAPAAIAEYRKAMALDPTFVAAYVNLADLYRARGAEADAEKTLREGLAHDPRSAVLHHSLGLVLVREKRKGEGLEELKTAAQLAPGNARYSYVYAVALHDAGQGKEALKVLNTALRRNPNDRDVLYGLAHFEGQAGNRERGARLRPAIDGARSGECGIRQDAEANGRRSAALGVRMSRVSARSIGFSSGREGPRHDRTEFGGWHAGCSRRLPQALAHAQFESAPSPVQPENAFDRAVASPSATSAPASCSRESRTRRSARRSPRPTSSRVSCRPGNSIPGRACFAGMTCW